MADFKIKVTPKYRPVLDLGNHEPRHEFKDEFNPSDLVYERVTGKGPFVLQQRKEGVYEAQIPIGPNTFQGEMLHDTWIAFWPRKNRWVYLSQALITHEKPVSRWTSIVTRPGKAMRWFVGLWTRMALSFGRTASSLLRNDPALLLLLAAGVGLAWMLVWTLRGLL